MGGTKDIKIINSDGPDYIQELNISGESAVMTGVTGDSSDNIQKFNIIGIVYN